MIPAPLPPNENERVAELLRHEILDTLAEKEFDEIVQLASQLCNAEIALISLVDSYRQWFKAKVGLDADETPKDIAFCSHAIAAGDDVFEITDATQDERFHDNPLVTGDPNIRFYAGQPIQSVDGYKLGTLCVIDNYPRELTPAQRSSLKLLAKQVEHLLALKLRVRQLDESVDLIYEQKRSLEESDEIKKQILAVLAHDLRSPVASLENMLDLFAEEILSAEEVSGLIQSVRPNLQQTIQQMEDVLAWVKDQIQTRSVQWQPFSLDKIADRSLQWVRHNAEKKGVILQKSINPKLVALGDPNLVEIVIRNLLSNAVKYTRKDDAIIVFVDHLDSNIHMGVQDTGVGIEAENLERILSRNKTLSTLGTAREKGTGLGLMLCQTYLNKMKTQLKVASQPGQGCCFSFILPFAGE
jgi:signal transduction histidine kinase